MILRNPSCRRDSFFLVCWLFLLLLPSGLVTAQGVEGYIRDAASHRPVEFAKISILKGDSIIYSIEADENGRYEYRSEEAHRIRLQVSQHPYKTFRTEPLLLDAYSVLRKDISLESVQYDLKEVTVTSFSESLKPFLHRISKDELNNMPGNFDDPVRAAISKPGIVQINDQSNNISFRGKSPILNSWYLEGLEIVNPNHTNNAGTLSDLPILSGGGVNMFSGNALGETEILTGIHSLAIGASTGAAVNMQLHESPKSEFRAKAGFLGFELGGGVGIGQRTMIDLNLRYSFTGLLGDFGVDFGGEQISYFDAVLSIRHEGPKHKLKLFVWSGQSENIFESKDETEAERFKDFSDIRYDNSIGGTGLRYDVQLSPGLFLKAGGAYSEVYIQYHRFENFISFENTNLDIINSIFSSFVELTATHSHKLHTTAGINFVDNDIFYAGSFGSPYLDNTYMRPYISTSFDISPMLTLELGAEVNHSTTYKKTIPGWRSFLTYASGDQSYFFGGYKHVAGAYFKSGPTIDLKPLLVDNYELGWKMWNLKNVLQANAFLNRTSGLAIAEEENGSQHLADYLDGFWGLEGTLSPGQHQAYGIEAEWKYQNISGLQFFVNQTVYKSLRKIEDQDYQSGRFDGGWATHFGVSKEIIRLKKNKSRIWNFSLRGIFNGGLPEQKINIAQSQQALKTIYDQPGIFSSRLPAYKRIDGSLSRTIGNGRIRWRYALDIQNLFGLKNIAFHYYDPYLQGIEVQNQLGIIPVLSIQASW